VAALLIYVIFFDVWLEISGCFPRVLPTELSSMYSDFNQTVQTLVLVDNDIQTHKEIFFHGGVDDRAALSICLKSTSTWLMTARWVDFFDVKTRGRRQRFFHP
jgi:hypothetical protein